MASSAAFTSRGLCFLGRRAYADSIVCLKSSEMFTPSFRSVCALARSCESTLTFKRLISIIVKTNRLYVKHRHSNTKHAHNADHLCFAVSFACTRLPENPVQHFLAIRPIKRHIIVAIASACRGRFAGDCGADKPRSALQFAAAAEARLPTVLPTIRRPTGGLASFGSILSRILPIW